VLKSKTIVPLYEQLMNKFKREIEVGAYGPGTQLPAELEMARQNNVSVVTVRKAMDELAAHGLVEKKQGKGTFVSQVKYDRDYTRITGFSESCRAMGLLVTSRLLEQKLIVPPEKFLKSLELPPGSQTVYISRLRFVNGEPMVIENNYFSLEYAFLLNESLDGSLFDVLRERHNVQVDRSQKIIEICRAKAAEAKLLNLRKNYPLLLVKSTAYTAIGEPVYVGSQLINGERFQLRI
jgi:GntR family transcriptional regulator